MTSRQQGAIRTLEAALKGCKLVRLAIYGRENSLLICTEDVHQQILAAGSAEEFMSGRSDFGDDLKWLDGHGVYKDSGA